MINAYAQSLMIAARVDNRPIGPTKPSLPLRDRLRRMLSLSSAVTRK